MAFYKQLNWIHGNLISLFFATILQIRLSLWSNEVKIELGWIGRGDICNLCHTLRLVADRFTNASSFRNKHCAQCPF